MKPYSSEKQHAPDNLTLLCPNHHREKTVGRLPSDVLVAANANPLNIIAGRTARHRLFYPSTDCIIEMGPLRFRLGKSTPINKCVPVAIDGMPLLEVQRDADGDVQVAIRLFDAFNRPILELNRNELTLSTMTWDAKLEGASLELRDKPGGVLLDIRFEAPNLIRVRRARFLRNGAELLVMKHAVLSVTNGTCWSDLSFENVGVALGYEETPEHPFFRCQDVPRYGIDRHGINRSAQIHAVQRRLRESKRRLPGKVKIAPYGPLRPN